MTVTYTTDGGLVGVSFLSAAEGGSGGLDGGFGGGGGLPSFGRTMLAELTSSLVLDEGTGGPTWSRATKAWAFNELGYLEELASGCAFFGGARLVRNTVRTKSEDFSNAAWTKNNVTVTGTNTLVCSAATVSQSVNQTATGLSTTIGQHILFGIRVKKVAGGADYIQILSSTAGFGIDYLNLNLNDGTNFVSGGVFNKVTQVAAGTYDVLLRCVSDATVSNGDAFSIAFADSLASTRNAYFTGDGVKSFELLRAWSVDVTNYDTSYIPEYVSVGVEASPYFGAGIDGAKYFETDWQGAPLSAASLFGFRREAAATNNLLHSRDLGNAAWSTKTNITAAKTATGLDGIANTATTLTATAADAIILQPITLASAARCASAYVKRRTGTGTVSFTQDGGSTWTDITAQINGSTWSRVQITSTLADPSVGFKISTSGNALDVDCVQNEAGAVATSPIVTTTAAVTRNTDVLSYQSAGNIDATIGTCFAECSVNFSMNGALAAPLVGLHASYFGILYFGPNLPPTTIYSRDGTNTVSRSGLASRYNSTGKQVATWNGNTLEKSVTGDGLSASTGTSVASLPITSIAIGGDTAAARAINGYIGPVAIYDYAMTDAELQAITS